VEKKLVDNRQVSLPNCALLGANSSHDSVASIIGQAVGLMKWGFNPSRVKSFFPFSKLPNHF